MTTSQSNSINISCLRHELARFQELLDFADQLRIESVAAGKFERVQPQKSINFRAVAVPFSRKCFQMSFYRGSSPRANVPVSAFSAGYAFRFSTVLSTSGNKTFRASRRLSPQSASICCEVEECNQMWRSHYGGRMVERLLV